MSTDATDGVGLVRAAMEDLGLTVRAEREQALAAEREALCQQAERLRRHLEPTDEPGRLDLRPPG